MIGGKSQEQNLPYNIGVFLNVFGVTIFVVGGFAQNLELVILGFIVGVLGALICRFAGKAFSELGIVLNPNDNRNDLQPLSQMYGGIFQEAFNGRKLSLVRNENLESENLNRVRCKQCNHLNPELTEYCQDCAEKL